MNSFQDYLSPFDPKTIRKGREFESSEIGSVVESTFDPENPPQLVIFNVEEERGAVDNEGCSVGAKEVRKYLYQLRKGDYNYSLVDLGTIKAGDQLSDTYFACKVVIKELLKHNCVPIILGGSQDLTLASYMAYGELEQMVNLLEVSANFSLGNTDLPVNSANYFSKVLLHQPNVLFNYSHLGYQSYFTDQQEIKLLNELHFDLHRLGQIKEDVRKAEPLMRNADFVSFNMNALSQAFSPSHLNGSPNGLNGEEACQLARYAGISDKLTSFGVYEYNSSIDERGLSAHLIAQMIWYFIDGFSNRKSDFPACNKSEYTRYTVAVDEGNQEMVFYKSSKSDRWWIEVPYQNKFRNRYQRHLLLPCDYQDYKTAMENEIPESWILTQQKLK
jgi:arginase family enzyme